MNECFRVQVILASAFVLLSLSAMAAPMCMFTFSVDETNPRLDPYNNTLEIERQWAMQENWWQTETINSIGTRVLKQKIVHLKPGTKIVEEGVVYEIEGILGASSSIVYRAKSLYGKKVVIKIIENEGMLIFEKRLTEFLLQKGYDIPKIIFSKGRMLIKDYFSGVTPVETEYIFGTGDFKKIGWSAADSSRIFDELATAEANYRVAVRGEFFSWMQKNYPAELAQIPEDLMSIFEKGDDTRNNFIYSLIYKKWRRFDP